MSKTLAMISTASGNSTWLNYETGKLAIDVINGSPLLRDWVDNPTATPQDLDALTTPDEQSWAAERARFLVY